MSGGALTRIGRHLHYGPIVRISHINVTMPAGSEELARRFYGELLGLREIPKPVELLKRGGVWFDAGGLDVHLSVDGDRPTAGADQRRHFGLEYVDVDALRERLVAAGVAVDIGRPAPWRRFFALDPFGNRIEIHEPGAFRGS
jgi:catechol 2,3-dioxygenase-like lactoylglutathione lyase family enzyme